MKYIKFVPVLVFFSLIFSIIACKKDKSENSLAYSKSEINQLKTKMEQGDLWTEIETNTYWESAFLIAAAQQRDYKEFERAIKNGADLNAYYIEQFMGGIRMTILEFCFANSNPNRAEFVQLLLENGADPNQISYNQGDHELFALKSAIISEDRKAFDLLIKYGADINWSNEAEGNSLFTAIKAEDIYFFDYLVDNNCDVNTFIKRNSEIVKLLDVVIFSIDSADNEDEKQRYIYIRNRLLDRGAKTAKEMGY